MCTKFIGQNISKGWHSNAILTIKLIKKKVMCTKFIGQNISKGWHSNAILTIKLIKKRSCARNSLDRIFLKDGIRMPSLQLNSLKKGHVHEIHWIEYF